MKNQIVREATALNLLCLVFMTSILLGCTSQHIASPPPVGTKVNETERTMTPSASRVFLPSPSPFPTLSSSQQELMTQRILSTYCELPCYMDINPGETSWLEASEVLGSMGANYLGNYRQNGEIVVHVYALKLCCEVANLIHTVSLKVDNNGVTQGINASVEMGFGNDLPEYWSRYSIRNIFEQFGPPDAVTMSVIHFDSRMPVELILLYDEIGVALEYSVFNDGDNCVKVSNVHGLAIILTNHSRGVNLWQEGIPFADSPHMKPAEEVLGMDEIEFYQRVISDPALCFDVLESTP